jgi:hypothetical protein
MRVQRIRLTTAVCVCAWRGQKVVLALPKPQTLNHRPCLAPSLRCAPECAKGRAGHTTRLICEEEDACSKGSAGQCVSVSISSIQSVWQRWGGERAAAEEGRW